MVISCFSFTEVARRAAAMMNDDGAMLTLTYAGSTRVMPNYNVMGVAKAGLEASVRYLASDFGPRGIRVNALSAGPVPVTCSPFSNAIPRCGAASTSTRWATRRFICCPISPRA
jgi:enoyl-[acyl-carrier-protein] reductase (NADH)